MDNLKYVSTSGLRAALHALSRNGKGSVATLDAIRRELEKRGETTTTAWRLV